LWSRGFFLVAHQVEVMHRPMQIGHDDRVDGQLERGKQADPDDHLDCCDIRLCHRTTMVHVPELDS